MIKDLIRISVRIRSLSYNCYCISFILENSEENLKETLKYNVPKPVNPPAKNSNKLVKILEAPFLIDFIQTKDFYDYNPNQHIPGMKIPAR